MGPHCAPLTVWPCPAARTEGASWCVLDMCSQYCWLIPWSLLTLVSIPQASPWIEWWVLGYLGAPGMSILPSHIVVSLVHWDLHFQCSL